MLRVATAATRRRLSLVAALALAGGIAANDSCAMPDCSRPRSNVERLVCTSDRLSAADQLMARAFRDAFLRTADREALLQDQESWQKQVRDACNDVPCLLRAYQDRTAELETW
jgi:uncharacterized protein